MRELKKPARLVMLLAGFLTASLTSGCADAWTEPRVESAACSIYLDQRIELLSSALAAEDVDVKQRIVLLDSAIMVACR